MVHELVRYMKTCRYVENVGKYVVGTLRKSLLRRSTSDAEEKYQVIRQYRWCKSREGTDVSSLTDLFVTNDTVQCFVTLMEVKLHLCLI